MEMRLNAASIWLLILSYGATIGNNQDENKVELPVATGVENPHAHFLI